MEGKHTAAFSSQSIPHNGDVHTKKRMQGPYREVWLSFLVMTVPMIVFSAILLGLTFALKVEHQGFASPNLRFPGPQEDDSVILVRINATTYATIASWSSTIAPILVGFAITLSSFPITKTIIHAAENNDAKEMPTPYQFALMLRMTVSGGPASLWHWLWYTVEWRSKGKKQAQPPVLRKMATVLVLGIFFRSENHLATFDKLLTGTCSLLVFITDTWLHFTTKTISFTQTSSVALNFNASYGLRDACFDVPRAFPSGCTLNVAATNIFAINGPEALLLINNVSDTNMVGTYNNDIAYLIPHPQTVSGLDYTATTYAVHTQCKPVTTLCFEPKRFLGCCTPYKCPFALEGQYGGSGPSALSEGPLRFAWFTDKSGKNNNTQFTNLDNPYYFGLTAALGGTTSQGAPIGKDRPNVAFQTHGGIVVALFCETTVLDTEYSIVNSTVTRFISRKSNSTMTNIIQGTLQHTVVEGLEKLKTDISIGTSKDTAQELADLFARSYSHNALAASFGAFTNLPPLEAQKRESMLVAKVPKVPLACLLIANLLLVALGVALTVFAIIALWSSAETGEVQAKLSVPGLTAERFEGEIAGDRVELVEELFEERRSGSGGKVGVIRTGRGGWVWALWRSQSGGAI